MIKKILITSVVLLAFAGCSEDKKQVVVKAAPLPVNVVTVQNKNVPVWMKFTGKTQAVSAQGVRARVSGILEEIYYKDGDYVKKGQKLFKIEQTDYIASLAIAKAQKKRDEAALSLAIADVNRYEPLVRDGLAARITLEQYQTKAEVLKADIASDQAKINQEVLQLSYTIVKAPIDGQASRRLVDIGNLVGKTESTLLTTINKTDPIYAYFAPSEEKLQVISQYRDSDTMPAYINTGYTNKMLKNTNIFGKVNFSDNTVDPTTSTVSMRAEIPNADHKILPGTFVYVNIFVTDKIKAIAIPPETVAEDQVGQYVYVMDKKNLVQKTYIKVAYESRYFTLVLEDTLKNGDKIIVSGLMHLKKGIELKPTDVTDTEGIEAVVKKHNLVPDMPKEKE